MLYEGALAFNLAILGALASPGPAFLMVSQSALRSGRRVGLMTALGLSVGATTWSVMALLGLTALFDLVPIAYMLLKICGAGYLIYLAFQIWRDAAAPVSTEAQSNRGGFWRGMIANLANPKAVIFIAAIFATILPREISTSLGAKLLVNQLLLEAFWYCGIALILTTKPMRSAYLRAKAWLDRISAVILGALAVRIAT